LSAFDDQGIETFHEKIANAGSGGVGFHNTSL
jgi:hypothetical protein